MRIITLRSAMEIGKATVLGNFRLRWPASGKGLDDSNPIPYLTTSEVDFVEVSLTSDGFIYKTADPTSYQYKDWKIGSGSGKVYNKFLDSSSIVTIDYLCTGFSIH